MLSRSTPFFTHPISHLPFPPGLSFPFNLFSVFSTIEESPKLSFPQVCSWAPFFLEPFMRLVRDFPLVCPTFYVLVALAARARVKRLEDTASSLVAKSYLVCTWKRLELVPMSLLFKSDLLDLNMSIPTASVTSHLAMSYNPPPPSLPSPLIFRNSRLHTIYSWYGELFIQTTRPHPGWSSNGPWAEYYSKYSNYLRLTLVVHLGISLPPFHHISGSMPWIHIRIIHRAFKTYQRQTLFQRFQFNWSAADIFTCGPTSLMKAWSSRVTSLVERSWTAPKELRAYYFLEPSKLLPDSLKPIIHPNHSKHAWMFFQL